MLDVSPPLLGALVLEGTLEFDDEAADEIHLQVGFLLYYGYITKNKSQPHAFDVTARR